MEETQMRTKFCKYCGEKIAMDAVICTHCGRQVEELKKSTPDNIIINNSAYASAGRVRKHHSALLDIILIFCTGGFWLFWMLIRPKYE